MESEELTCAFRKRVVVLEWLWLVSGCCGVVGMAEALATNLRLSFASVRELWSLERSEKARPASMDVFVAFSVMATFFPFVCLAKRPPDKKSKASLLRHTIVGGCLSSCSPRRR